MTAWIALTGGIGSGKSQAALYFQGIGVPVIDTDAVNRELITTPNSPALRGIARTFGAQMLDENGILRRDAMRRLIFGDSCAKARLEALLHPLIIRAIRQRQHGCTAGYGLVELPTLAEHPHFGTLVRRVLLIHARQDVRVARVMRRNGLSEQEVLAIVAAQADDAQRLAIADDVITNHSTPDALQHAVLQQHAHYAERFAPHRPDTKL